MRTINYYDKNKTRKSIEFVQVLNRWVEYNGGAKEFLRDFKRLNDVDHLQIPSQFISYFLITYNATLPDEEDERYQHFLYDLQFYLVVIQEIDAIHNTRLSSPNNIITLVIIALAIIGLISMCS